MGGVSKLRAFVRQWVHSEPTVQEAAARLSRHAADLRTKREQVLDQLRAEQASGWPIKVAPR